MERSAPNPRPQPPKPRTSAAPERRSTFRAFYKRHMDTLLHFLRFYVLRDVDRIDVASLAFQVAARDFDSFTVPEGMERDEAERTWLFTIARKVADNWRKKHRQPEQIDVDDVQAPADLESETAAFELVRDLLWTLPEHLRTLYLWHHLVGETHEKIAERLGMPVGTVKSQLRAAQEKLDAAIDRLCAREGMTREDYLRSAMPLPFAGAEGLAGALRGPPAAAPVAPPFVPCAMPVVRAVALAKHCSKPWIALLAAVPAGTWRWTATRIGRWTRALASGAAIPLMITSHDILDALGGLDAEIATSALHATEGKLPGSGRGVSEVIPDAVPAVEDRAPAVVRGPSPAAPARPGPHASPIGARRVAATATGPAEDRLIRAATHVIATSPEHALVLLHEHGRRFPQVNVELRNELLRQARAALGTVAASRPGDR